VIATYGAQVVDAFYVKDMFGLKLHAKSRQEALEKKLRQAISEGRRTGQRMSSADPQHRHAGRLDACCRAARALRAI
jgi:hypothetical protein